MNSAFQRGMKHGISGVFSLVLAATFLGIGSLCQSLGFSLFWTCLASGLIWAGPAHVILAAGIGAKTPLLALALTIGLSSVRMMPMVVSLMPFLHGGTKSKLKLYFCAHIVSISSWIEGMRELPKLPLEDRVPFFLGLGVSLLTTSTLATALGFYISGHISKPFAAALLFLTPIFFLLSLLNSAKQRVDYIALFLGIAGLLLTSLYTPTLALLIAGLGGGTLAFLLRKKV